PTADVSEEASQLVTVTAEGSTSVTDYTITPIDGVVDKVLLHMPDGQATSNAAACKNVSTGVECTFNPLDATETVRVVGSAPADGNLIGVACDGSDCS